ncbi:MAG: hypothetical protein FJ388_20865, partial [Verrucomicrobia bacterium]|nr:hypothetical protein [Verrucomicrobiota bacterium]
MMILRQGDRFPEMLDGVVSGLAAILFLLTSGTAESQWDEAWRVTINSKISSNGLLTGKRFLLVCAVAFGGVRSRSPDALALVKNNGSKFEPAVRFASRA